jgi:hypothetical protein
VDEAIQAEVIRSVLMDMFPDECRRVGKANLNDIVRLRGRVRFEALDGASRLDLAVPLALLATAAAILGHAATIASTWRESHRRDASKLCVEINLSLPAELAGKLEPPVLENLLTGFVERLLAEKDVDRRDSGAPGASPSSTILIAVSEPTELARLQLGRELREIQEALDLSIGRGRWPVQARTAVRIRDLSRALLELRPRVVHFSGHGSGAGNLYLEAEDGHAQPVPEEALAALFKVVQGVVECVVLNACFSEPQARAIAAYVPHVVGTPSSIADDCAIAFSVGFYQALGNGSVFAQAYVVGCAHMQAACPGGSPLPVLIGDD